MGYSTDFTGSFKLDRPLTPAHRAYLAKFGDTRRMARTTALDEDASDPLRKAVGLPVGPEGAYYVGDDRRETSNGTSVADMNRPPKGQPGLWCQWTPSEDGTAIEWDGGEKFYRYAAWLKYLIEHFLGPWEYRLNGEVEWRGEDHDDQGKIVVRDNVVEIYVRAKGYVLASERNPIPGSCEAL